MPHLLRLRGRPPAGRYFYMISCQQTVRADK